MRQRFLVAYDIRDPSRLHRIHRFMKGQGEPLQYSVFLCDLAPMERALMKERLEELINHEDDQILILRVGPLEGNWRDRMEFMGRTTELPTHGAKIV